MKLCLLTLVSLMLIACGSKDINSPPNQNPGAVPAAMSCPASQDPAQGCPSPSAPAVPLDVDPQYGNRQNKREAAAGMKAKTQKIEGRCELWVPGAKRARSCKDVKVMVRSVENGEMRDGVVQGFGVRFSDLNEPKYNVIATSTEWELSSTPEEAEPGKRILIKIQAKPRTN